MINCKEVKYFLCKLSWNTIYLPAYSPIYAPIENWVGLIKAYLKRKYKTEDTKVNLKYNYSEIYDALKSIRSTTVIKMFADLIKRISQN